MSNNAAMWWHGVLIHVLPTSSFRSCCMRMLKCTFLAPTMLPSNRTAFRATAHGRLLAILRRQLWLLHEAGAATCLRPRWSCCRACRDNVWWGRKGTLDYTFKAQENDQTPNFQHDQYSIILNDTSYDAAYVRLLTNSSKLGLPKSAEKHQTCTTLPKTLQPCGRSPCAPIGPDDSGDMFPKQTHWNLCGNDPPKYSTPMFSRKKTYWLWGEI